MDTTLQVQRGSDTNGSTRQRHWSAVFVSICVLASIGFLLLPGSIEGKSLAALHGLCAQQPSHSFYFGEQRLPFDARMTGIYGGFAFTALYLLVRGRWRFGGIPSPAVTLILAFFIVAMGIDGLNSTLRDMGVWYAYEPRNALRLVSGLLTGTTLAVFIWLMLGQVGFAGSTRVRRSPVTGVRDLGALMAVQAAAAAIILSGWNWLRLPLTFLLLIAAIAVISGLTLAFVILLGRREGQAVQTSDLAGPATVALVIALLIIGALGGGRFLLEWWLGIEPVVRSIG